MKKKIYNPEAVRDIMELLEKEKTEGLFEYKNSLWVDGEPCVECDSETGEAQSYELEQAERGRSRREWLCLKRSIH